MMPLLYLDIRRNSVILLSIRLCVSMKCYLRGGEHLEWHNEWQTGLNRKLDMGVRGERNARDCVDRIGEFVTKGLTFASLLRNYLFFTPKLLC